LGFKVSVQKKRIEKKNETYRWPRSLFFCRTRPSIFGRSFLQRIELPRRERRSQRKKRQPGRCEKETNEGEGEKGPRRERPHLVSMLVRIIMEGDRGEGEGRVKGG
jgi:hypothetical protein